MSVIPGFSGSLLGLIGSGGMSIGFGKVDAS
jgi:hypothetical protein